MKKAIILSIILVFLVLIVLSVYLCIEFFGLYRSSEAQPKETVTTAALSDLESFVQEKWKVERAEYDGKYLTLYKSYALSYEQACKVGGNIFTDDLAPESYLPLTATIAADINTNFNCPGLVVILRYLSEDGKVIFSVDSNGSVETCWNTDK